MFLLSSPYLLNTFIITQKNSFYCRCQISLQRCQGLQQPDSVSVVYEREDEGNPQANCMCDVDNEFDLYSIESGTYTLVFHSCYPDPLSATFSF